MILDAKKRIEDEVGVALAHQAAPVKVLTPRGTRRTIEVLDASLRAERGADVQRRLGKGGVGPVPDAGGGDGC